MLLIAEIFRHRQSRQSHAQTRSRRFRHLSVNQRRARFFRITGHHHAGFLKFNPQVIAFARTLAHTRKHRHAAVLHGHVVDQFLNQNRFADTRAAKQSDFSALQKGLNQIDNLDSRLKHF